MSVKKVGLARIDLETGLWTTLQGGAFRMKERILEKRDSFKDLRKRAKEFPNRPPKSRAKDTRLAYYRERDVVRKEEKVILAKIYKEIVEESFEMPIPLRKDHDYDHHFTDWRFCLYGGVVYQFDRPDYPPSVMLEEINAYNARKAKV